MTYQPCNHVLNLLGQNQCPCFVDEKKKKAKQLRYFLVQRDNFHCSKHARVERPITNHFGKSLSILLHFE
jgi:hypothetical protein